MWAILRGSIFLRFVIEYWGCLPSFMKGGSDYYSENDTIEIRVFD